MGEAGRQHQLCRAPGVAVVRIQKYLKGGVPGRLRPAPQGPRWNRASERGPPRPGAAPPAPATAGGRSRWAVTTAPPPPAPEIWSR